MEDIYGVKYFSLAKLKKFVKELEKDPKKVKDLSKMIVGDDQVLSMRASWTLVHLSYSRPDLVSKEIPVLMKFLKKTGQHTGAIRNTLNIFNEINIPEKYCGELFDHCISYTKNATLPHAVRAFAITILATICQKYPELKPEVALVLNELSAYPQPASITVRIRNANKVLAKI